MNTQPNRAADELATRILSTSFESVERAAIYWDLLGGVQNQELTHRDWITPLVLSEGNLSLKVPSGEGAHFIRYRPNGSFKAVYAGPHGPENRPADINEQNIQQLLEVAEAAEVLPTIETPFRAIEVAGDAK